MSGTTSIESARASARTPRRSGEVLPPRRRRAAARLALDVVALAAAAAVAAVTTDGSRPSFVVWAAVFGALALLQFASRGSYARRLRRELLEEARAVVSATAIAAMAALALQLVIVGTATPQSIVMLWLLSAAYVVGVRVGSRAAAVRAARSERDGAPTLIIGAGRVGQLIASRLLENPGHGLRPVGFLDKDPLDEKTAGLPVLGASWDLERAIRAHAIENVIVTFSTAPAEVVLGIVRRCEQLGVTVSSVPRLYESVGGRMTLEHFGGIPLLTKDPVDPRGWQFRLKYAFERVAALALALALLPVFAAIAIAVRLSLGGPVLFRQVRIGRDGRPFEMLKFRSMVGDAPDRPVAHPRDGAVAPGGVEGADRRTRLGRILRRTSLDELPQLLNVVLGDMSVVGPRPERPEFVEAFERTVYRYADRHRVKVGITGWAQVHGLRGKTSLADRVEWDNYYIENWSPWLDVKTLLLTALALLRGYRTAE